MTLRWELERVRLTRRFFVGTVLQAAVCLSFAVLLGKLLGVPETRGRLSLPAAFQFGTFFLAAGSWSLHRALTYVRTERQYEFRAALAAGIGFAMLFVIVQSYGLWAFARSTADYRQTQLNVHSFVFVFTALHAMHFLVAQSVLLWVTLSAFIDRYDHEYYWGVTFAAWLWHALGIAWLAILCVFSIAV